VTVTNQAGCSSSDSVQVVLYETPETPVIQLIGAELVVSPLPDPSWIITWFLDNEPVKDAGNDTLTVFATGQYTVRLESAQGCAAISNPFEISTVNNSSSAASAVYVRTIPGAWVVQGIESNAGRQMYYLFDVSGKLVANGSFSSGSELEINNAALLPGLYMLRMDADGLVTYKTKLVKIN
jgi:hypothetical protein